MSEVDIILIGRNEGARLERCLASVKGKARRLIYVDSGSTDGSMAAADAAGAEALALSTDVPFTAARARHHGFAHLEATGGAAAFVQFIDGDCDVQPDWIETGVSALNAQPDLGLVTGWRSEIAPQASVFNAMCDVEWHRPAGDILTCGGDMMVRSEAYRAAGGFNAQVIAAEDDEFCCRMRAAGWRLHRMPLDMTRHDADMLRFAQWWRRAERTGHGFEQVNDLPPTYFRKERLRMWLYGAAAPALFLIGLLFGVIWLCLGILGLYALSYLRAARGLISREGLDAPQAWDQALYLTLSKIPNALGGVRYRWRKLKGHDMAIIEYK